MLVRRKKARDDVPTLTDVVDSGGPLAAKPDLHKTSPRAKIHNDPSLRPSNSSNGRKRRWHWISPSRKRP
jgi:hypothetical protein